MSNKVALPVIAGLSAGIAVIIALAIVINSSSNNSSFGTATPNNLDLTIEGLRDSYRA